jgi:hypothetical protein
VVRWRGADYVNIYPGPRVRPEMRAVLSNPSDLDFGGYARLVGHEVETPEVAAGDTAVLALYWEPMASFPADDFSVYVGLRDAQGQLYGRADSQPVGRFVPVSLWQPGQVVRDAQQIRIPPGTPPGDYTLEVGFFSPSLGQTLEIRDAIAARGDRVPLAQLRVRAAEHSPRAGDDLGVAHLLEPPLALGANGPLLLGYEAELPAALTAGDGLPVTLLWRAGEAPPMDAEIFVQLRADERVWRRSRGHTSGQIHPLEGQLTRDAWTALLPVDAPAGRYQLELAAVSPAGEMLLATLGEVDVTARAQQFAAPQPAYPEGKMLGEAAQLVGYDLGGVAACDGAVCLKGEPLELTLYWRVVGESDRDLVRFVHLLDAEDRIVAQNDAAPGGIAATSWAAGEFVADDVALEVEGLSAGDYRLAVGLYDPATGQRLMIPGGEDRIVLSQTVVAR